MLRPRSLLGLATPGAYDSTPKRLVVTEVWTASNVGSVLAQSLACEERTLGSFGSRWLQGGSVGRMRSGPGRTDPAPVAPWPRPAPPSLRLIGSRTRVGGCQGDVSLSCESAQNRASRPPAEGAGGGPRKGRGERRAAAGLQAGASSRPRTAPLPAQGQAGAGGPGAGAASAPSGRPGGRQVGAMPDGGGGPGWGR